MKKKNNSSEGLFSRRLIAFVFDIFLVSSLVSFICMPFLDHESINNLSENATQVLVDYNDGNIDTAAYISSASSILYRLAEKQGLISLVTILLNVLYFVVYQFYSKGQTIGKKILGIKVLGNDSKELTMDNYIYRSFIINSVLVDMISFTFLIFATQELYIVGVGMIGLINYIVLFVCGLMVLFGKDGRGLHDLVGNTKVVESRSRL